MEYVQLSEQAKLNAVENYCRIMGIPVDIYRDEIIEWFLTRKIDTLDENGNFIAEIKK